MGIYHSMYFGSSNRCSVAQLLDSRARLVHAGFIVVLLGVFWHAQYARSYNFALQLGESIKLAHMDWRLENIYQGTGDNYQAYAFELTSQLNGKPIQLFPERRHPVRDMTNAKSDNSASWFD